LRIEGFVGDGVDLDRLTLVLHAISEHRLHFNRHCGTLLKHVDDLIGRKDERRIGTGGCFRIAAIVRAWRLGSSRTLSVVPLRRSCDLRLSRVA